MTMVERSLLLKTHRLYLAIAATAISLRKLSVRLRIWLMLEHCMV